MICKGAESADCVIRYTLSYQIRNLRDAGKLRFCHRRLLSRKSCAAVRFGEGMVISTKAAASSRKDIARRFSFLSETYLSLVEHLTPPRTASFLQLLSYLLKLGFILIRPLLLPLQLFA
jgi:hypothetical protein